MEQSHSSDKWMCFSCNEMPLAFENASDYEVHLRGTSTHADSFTEAQLPMLVQAGKTPITPQFKNCPLCNWSQRHAEFNYLTRQDSDIIYPTAETIQDHVAEHLHSFALQALPDLDDEDGSSLQLSSGSVELNLKLLKESEVEPQYDIGARVAARNQLADMYLNSPGEFEAVNGQLSVRERSVVSSSLLKPRWIPTVRQMVYVNTIISTADQPLSDPTENQAAISIIMSCFRELVADIISQSARRRWKSWLLVIRLCVSSYRPRTLKWGTKWGPLLEALSLGKRLNFELLENIAGNRCHFCITITRFFELLDESIKLAMFPFHKSVGAVKRSATLGCQLCKIFLAPIKIHSAESPLQGAAASYPARVTDLAKVGRHDSEGPKLIREVPRLIKAPPGSKLCQFIDVNFSKRVFGVVFAENEHGEKILTLKAGTSPLQVYELSCARG